MELTNSCFTICSCMADVIFIRYIQYVYIYNLAARRFQTVKHIRTASGNDTRSIYFEKLETPVVYPTIKC